MKYRIDTWSVILQIISNNIRMKVRLFRFFDPPIFGNDLRFRIFISGHFHSGLKEKLSLNPCLPYLFIEGHPRNDVIKSKCYFS